jgi:thiamine biosynthesis lipoprotein
MIGERLYRRSFVAMGTECSLGVTTRRRDLARAQRAMRAGFLEVERCERALSRFRPTSDLSRLNRGNGSWVGIDARLLDALTLALRLRDETDGRYDPTILPALTAAGYDRSFEQLEGRAPFGPGDWHARTRIDLDLGRGRALVEAGSAVDLGGVGKGFAAGRVLSAMREAWVGLPGAIVDLGGDIAVWGATPEDGPWQLAIADPRRPGTSLGTLRLSQGAVATSGRGCRRFGPRQELHHLIDPRTGRPDEQGLLAATVVGPDAGEADGYATALAVSPITIAHAVIANRYSLAALLVPVAGAPVAVGDLPLVVKQYELSEVVV